MVNLNDIVPGATMVWFDTEYEVHSIVERTSNFVRFECSNGIRWKVYGTDIVKIIPPMKSVESSQVSTVHNVESFDFKNGTLTIRHKRR